MYAMKMGGLLFGGQKLGKVVCEYLSEKKNTGVSNAFAIGSAMVGMIIHFSGGHGAPELTISDW